MVFVQVELKYKTEVQDLISFLLERSYNNFRVTEHDLLVSGTSTVGNVPSISNETSTFLKNTLETSQGDCPNLMEVVSEEYGSSSMFPETSIARSVDQKPIPIEISDDDDDENDLSIDNPTEASGEFSEASKRKAVADRLRGSRWDELEKLDTQKLRDCIIALKKTKMLSQHTHCAVCEAKIMTTAKCFIKHVSSRHMALHKSCSIYGNTFLVSSNVITHCRTEVCMCCMSIQFPIQGRCLESPAKAYEWNVN